MNMKTEELRPCPFCGQQHGVDEGRDLHWGPGWFISCNRNVVMQAYTEKECVEMVQRWNKRPIEDALRGEVERLTEIMQTPAAVEFNLKAGRIAMPRSLHWDGDDETALRAKMGRLRQVVTEAAARLRDIVVRVGGPQQISAMWVGEVADELEVALCGASPWAEQLGLTQEEARKIAAGFQRGILSESAMDLIDVDVLISEASK